MDSRNENVRVISLASGFISGILRTIVGHPFDTMKVISQTRQMDVNNSSYISSKVRLRTLYKGIGPPLMSMGVITSLNFSLYENFRLTLLNALNPSKGPLESMIIFSSGVLAGGTLVFVTSPLDNLKVIQQTETSTNKFNMIRLINGKASFNFYRGLTSNLVVAGLGRGFYISGYTETKRLLQSRLNYGSDSILVRAVAASVAGFCGWFFLFPFDVVRSNMMADYRSLHYTSTIHCFRSIVTQKGVRGLYSGLGYTLVRAVPVAIAGLLAYDYSQEFLLRNFMRPL